MTALKNKKVVTLCVIATAIVFAAGMSASATSVGQILQNVQIKDAADKPASIPDLGNKVLCVLYNDADAADMNDPLADALKAKDYPKEKFRAMGIVNMKDSKAPNFLIRKIIKGKIEKYNTTILTDTDLILPTAWGFGDCNNQSVCVIIGKDKAVKYYKNGGVRGAEIDQVVKIVDGLMK